MGELQLQQSGSGENQRFSRDQRASSLLRVQKKAEGIHMSSRNIRIALSEDQLKRLLAGEVVTIVWRQSNREPEPTTVDVILSDIGYDVIYALLQEVESKMTRG
jgi:hypothetical protein